VVDLLEAAGARVDSDAGPTGSQLGDADALIAGRELEDAESRTGGSAEGPSAEPGGATRLRLVVRGATAAEPASLPLPVSPSELRRRLCRTWGVAQRARARPRSPLSREHDLARGLLRVLVADDDEMGRRISCEILEGFGIRPVAAVDGAEALRAIESGGLDLAILDLRMPGIDGVEVGRRARRSLGDRCPRLVALSANVVAADREECLAAGFERFLTKPVRPEDLLAVVRELEAARRAARNGVGGASV
jgi:CheY-like chemotaxis protein